MRAKIASRLRINPAGIAFVATHTHSGPAMSGQSADTDGIRNAEFGIYWKETVMQVAEKAFLEEEEIASMQAGKAPLANPIGVNRVEPEKNFTDPAIRWMRFCRKDGSTKLLIHNHGVHGIADGGTLRHKLSSDWMGAANRIIREEKLADFALFLQGPSGDINTRTSCGKEKRESVGEELAREYVSYLAKDLAAGEEIPPGKIAFGLETFEFPTVRQTPEELLDDVKAFRPRGKSEREIDYWNINGCRLEEMAFLVEKGYDLGSYHDLQVIRIGEAEFFFIPGEYYVEEGQKLLKGASRKYAFAATLSNGAGGYYFSGESARKFPSPFTRAEKLFGYYEIYGYMHKLTFKYQDNIAEFIRESLLKMEVK